MEYNLGDKYILKIKNVKHYLGEGRVKFLQILFFCVQLIMCFILPRQEKKLWKDLCEPYRC